MHRDVLGQIAEKYDMQDMVVVVAYPSAHWPSTNIQTS